MESERWQQIERLYNAAVNLAGDQRAAFLRQECQDDEALRAEVESLLAHHSAAADFIESPAFEVVARLMAKEKPAGQPTDQLATGDSDFNCPNCGAPLDLSSKNCPGNIRLFGQLGRNLSIG